MSDIIFASLLYNHNELSNLTRDMLLTIDFFTTDYDLIQRFVMPPHTHDDDTIAREGTLVAALRSVIDHVRALEPVAPVECRLTLLGQNTLAASPPNFPLLRRLVVELASFHIYDVRIDLTSLSGVLERHIEILRFVETLQTNVTLFSLIGTPVNDFILAWWIEQVLVRPAFLPRLELVWLGTSTPLDEAVTLRLIEAFSQSPRENLGWLLFRPALPAQHPADILYLARLLQCANENIYFLRHALACTVGRQAFDVLGPMLPYARPALRLSADPTLDDNETLSFIFDESILANDGANVGFVAMTLQQYTAQRHLFNHETIVLTRRV